MRISSNRLGYHIPAPMIFLGADARWWISAIASCGRRFGRNPYEPAGNPPRTGSSPASGWPGPRGLRWGILASGISRCCLWESLPAALRPAGTHPTSASPGSGPGNPDPDHGLDPGRGDLIDARGVRALIGRHARHATPGTPVVDEVDRSPNSGTILARPRCNLICILRTVTPARRGLASAGAGIHQRPSDIAFPPYLARCRPSPGTRSPALGVLRRLRPTRAFSGVAPIPIPAPWPGDGLRNAADGSPSLLSG